MDRGEFFDTTPLTPDDLTGFDDPFDCPPFTGRLGLGGLGRIELPEGARELTEEGLSRLIGDLLADGEGGHIDSPVPVAWQLSTDEFHELMGRSVVAQRIACLPTDQLEQYTTADDTLMFNSKPMMVLLFSEHLTGDIDIVVAIDPKVALMFAEQLTTVARVLLEGRQ